LKSLSEKKNRVKESLTHNGMDYLNSYQYIIDTRGNPIAVISIPYFQLDENYKRDIRTYLVALTPIYIILFLGASIMAFLLSRQITEPMRKLSQIMRKAALTKRYMPLRWNSSDEIGQLVHQYNFMVKELEKSSEALAQTQKESAWKEMAKQVAHEIKNPLTPMKLNVQLFERHLDPTDPEFEQKLKVFSGSIIEQIDTLSNIATAFSDFARMPSSNKEEINFCEIVANAIAFYDVVTIKYTQSLDKAMIFADQDQIIRVLNNVLNNAIEAAGEENEPEIALHIKQIDERVLLTIKDNGRGIPRVLYDKIFEPNFTTKNSGMGLGLAMVKRIIDDAGGEIYFESTQNKGTTFYICLPLLKQNG
jgi:nitrogen fixation/metabolism regulation signal transduction histidine kinase